MLQVTQEVDFGALLSRAGVQLACKQPVLQLGASRNECRTSTSIALASKQLLAVFGLTRVCVFCVCVDKCVWVLVVRDSIFISAFAAHVTT